MLSSLVSERQPTPGPRAQGPIAIQVSHVTKRYRRYEYRNMTLKSRVVDWLRSRPDRFVEFEALKDVSVSVERGEMLAVIGRNGAGKSTLLRIISGIVEPDSGSVEVNGRISPLLQLGTGFAVDLSGRRNIYLYGALLGLNRRQIAKRLDAIIQFSGIADFIDTPVKHYSSGMAARLGFAIAAHMDPDLLLLDEVLSVGDAEFQAKCLARMRRFREEGKTIVLVTHSLQSAIGMCDRAVLLDHGSVVTVGPSRSVAAIYEELLG